jgi:hypothetical protein
MGRNGWSYLVVEHPTSEPSDGSSNSGRPYRASDGDGFATESEMFSELGTCGWELVTVRNEPGRARYYFKRPRT